MDEDKKLVLCIDDDADALYSLKLILENAGFQVVTENTVASGLAAYQARKPDAIVVDLMMDEVDAGISFVRQIHALGPVPPIYMLSSVGAALTTNVNASELGIKDVLQKPADPKTLVELLRSSL